MRRLPCLLALALVPCLAARLAASSRLSDKAGHVMSIEIADTR